MLDFIERKRQQWQSDIETMKGIGANRLQSIAEQTGENGTFLDSENGQLPRGLTMTQRFNRQNINETTFISSQHMSQLEPVETIEIDKERTISSAFPN